MKRNWLKTVIALVLIVLMLGGLIVFASGASPMYLMAINNNVLQATNENMPMIFGGILYIPYTMLSVQETGIDMGVRTQYSSGQGTLTVSDGEKTVVFDLRRNIVQDEQGIVRGVMTLVRNSMIYLPADWLCEYFGQLGYSVSSTSYGILVRIMNQNALLLDTAEFIDAADSLLRKNWEDYHRAQRPSSQPPTTSPTGPSVSPSVTPPPTPSVSPSVPPTETPSVSPSISPEPELTAEVWLALRHGKQTRETVDLLEEHDRRALLLFTVRELVEQDDLVRRLTARGHQVGLVLQGDDLENCLQQLNRGRELLRDISRSALLIVSADELAESDRAVIEETGCALWVTDEEITAGSWTELSRRLNTERPNQLLLSCDENAVESLKRILYNLVSERYELRQVFAPMLQQ